MGDISIKGRSPILRQGYAAGGIAKGGIKAGKRFLDFIKTGKHVDKKGTKVNVPKAAERLTGKPHVDRVKKAVGGRLPPKDWKDYKPREWPRSPEKSLIEQAGGSEKGKPHSTKEGRIASGTRRIRRLLAGKGRPKAGPQAPSRPLPKWKNMPWNPKEKPKWKNMPRNPNEKPKWQAMEMKKGGKADKKWIQKATASIKKRGTKGKCTPITKPGCTGRAKALAKTFKKMAKERKAA